MAGPSAPMRRSSRARSDGSHDQDDRGTATDGQEPRRWRAALPAPASAMTAAPPRVLLAACQRGDILLAPGRSHKCYPATLSYRRPGACGNAVPRGAQQTWPDVPLPRPAASRERLRRPLRFTDVFSADIKVAAPYARRRDRCGNSPYVGRSGLRVAAQDAGPYLRQNRGWLPGKRTVSRMTAVAGNYPVMPYAPHPVY